MLPRAFVLLLAAGALPAAQDAPSKAELAVKKLRAADGLRVELAAAEPLLANPVAFWIDDRGRTFVAESHRVGAPVFDVPSQEDDLACRTVEDRLAMIRKHLGPDAERLARDSERVRLVEDRDGDGRADRSTVFAEGFAGLADGLAAGVLSRGNDVWFACVPNLWLLRDTDGDGAADVRTALHTGFGVRNGYYGHDLHGLRFGPDGKLYFTMADRGFHVQAGGRTLSSPDSGAVLRCNPDGSDLEVYATGLRNPQELAFDAHGNLWTGDNNADFGDKARWVYVVEGGDSGWRFGYQYLPKGGPWLAEKLWEAADTAPYRLPPVGHVGHGPSGVAFNPGTGLPPAYDRHFFMADFPGSVKAFSVRPKGASFELADVKDFLRELMPTDVDFGPDGAVYVLDWVEGWTKTGKGRIFRVFDPAVRQDPDVRETRKLLAGGVPADPTLLAHRDFRVRQAAQFALAGEGRADALAQAAARGSTLFARLHGVWGLGQIGPDAAARAVARLDDPEAEVRAQAARTLGDRRVGAAFDGLVKLLKDESPRVRFFAAAALGKLGRREAIPPLFELVRANADRDPYLRHAAVMGLAGIGDVEALAAARSASRPSRLAALLALRRLRSVETRLFLLDLDPALVLEAARAIHDEPVEAALPALALHAAQTDCPEPVLPRALNAAFRQGTQQDASILTALALRKTLPAAIRAEALRALGEWARPPGRDRVLGLWRPLPPRDPAPAKASLGPRVSLLFRDASEEVRVEAVRAAGRLGLSASAEALADLCRAAETPAGTRVEALRALVTLPGAPLAAAFDAALADRAEAVRREAILLLPKAGRTDAAALLERLFREDERVPVRQACLRALGRVEGAEADGALSGFLDRLAAGEVPASLHLELLEAAARRTAPEVRDKLARHEASRDKADPLSSFRETLEGGDAAEGRRVFFRSHGAGCGRCHRVKDEGGSVGPPLTGVGGQRTRLEILESIVVPNAKITEGYGQVLLSLKSGEVVAGRVERETDAELVLLPADGNRRRVPKAEVAARKPGLSAMPEDAAKTLSKRELRDLVAYLAGLK
jgi:quinoprotein glucose dehydrogenase